MALPAAVRAVVYSFLGVQELLTINHVSQQERLHLLKMNKIIHSKRQKPLTYRLEAPDFTGMNSICAAPNFLDFFFEAGERVHLVIGIEEVDFFKAKLLKHISLQQKFVLDLRITSQQSL